MYKKYTVEELIKVLKDYASELPDKLNSFVTLGDFEGNYEHEKLEPAIDRENNTLCLQYEMHEGNRIQKMIDSGELSLDIFNRKV